jgi:dihydrofolate synthase/folylpolyglutamate synthase
MKQKTGYQEGIEYLYNLQKYGIKFGLSKTSNLMKAFGNPQKGRKYIHIAGTNGKGSVATFVASILKQAGFRVGLYSSPHLVRFTERFRINDKEISRKKAAGLIDELRGTIMRDSPPTFFEATTAMAFLYFAREDTDIAIMEVGMGGRLDATNLITPLVSVITNISMEHQFFLGSRLLDIAGEKGGIIKEGVDLVTGATQPSVISLFKSICREKGTAMWRVGKDVKYRTTSYGFHYKGITRRFNRLQLGLKGNFQFRNAALALATIELLEKQGFRISSGDIRKGLKDSAWPGRMQVMAENPTVLLDGAHNPAAIKALAESIRTGFEYRRLILVIGIMADKEIGQLLRGIVPIADYVIHTRPVYSRAADPEILMKEAAPFKRPSEVEPLLTRAIEKAKDMADPEDLIVICGSLFTVGEALTYFDPETYGTDGFQ